MAGMQGQANSAAASMTALGGATAKTGTSLLGMAGNLAGAAFMFSTVAGLVVSAAGSLYKMSEAGAEIDYTRQKFDRLSESMGTTGDIMLGQLRVATKGTLSDFQLTKQGTDLFQLGLAKTTEEAVRLSTVMTALGMDTGELTLALANQSKRRLDQLGLSLTEFNKNEALFKAKGLNKEDAFTQAFLATAEQTVLKIGNRADSSAGSFDRLTASWDNLKNSMKMSTADTFTGFNNSTAGALDWIQQKNREADAWEAYAARSKYKNLRFDNAAQLMEAQKDDRPRIPGVNSQAATPQVDTTDYANLLKVGTSLTDMTGKYNDKLNQLAEKLIDAPKKFGATAEQAEMLKNSLTGINAMSGMYNVTLMQQLQRLTAAEGAYGKNDARVRDLREGIKKLKEDAVQANNEMLLGTMANAGATDQQQADFARASGMISEQAWQQATALAKISQAYLTNKITADQAANAARGVASGMASINGFNAVGYVDIYITYHESGGGGGVRTGTGSNMLAAGSGAIGYDTRSGGPIVRRASGGPVGAGEISGITEYGEPEVFSSGGKQYLISGKRGGYVSSMNAQSGGSFNQMHALVSRIPTAEENARALVKALKAVG